MFDGKSEVEEIFSEAWQKVLAGHSIESVVTQYPGYAAEIEPMLRLTAAVRAVPPPALSAGALARIQQRAQAAVQERDRERMVAPVVAATPGSDNHRAYVSYVQPKREPKSWFARLLPTSLSLRGSIAVLLMLAILLGTMAAIRGLSQQENPQTELETYSGTITKITATALWLGDKEILVDQTTKIYGEPKLGAEMVCVGRSLTGERMQALEVWIRSPFELPTVVPTEPISLYETARFL